MGNFIENTSNRRVALYKSDLKCSDYSEIIAL